MHRWGKWRLITVNLAGALFFLPLPSWIKVALSILVTLTYAIFLPLLFKSIRAAVAVRKAQAKGEPVPAPPPGHTTLGSKRQTIAAVCTVALFTALGLAADPGALSFRQFGNTSASEVTATGESTRVTVTALDMAFSPNSIEVPAGNRLLIEFVNEDPALAHDLVVGSARSGRLQPGESATLDVGIISEDIEGYCSIAGHRQMGMTLTITTDAPGTEGAGSHGHDGATGGTNAILADHGAELGTTVDPRLSPADDSQLHKYTLEVVETPLEVAPGRWQTRWTFNGGSVGPTLRGKVGDEFEITLVNRGTMGHSVDFHAGDISPDEPMRTIQPGESLVYRFVANRSGAWLYHCSTKPMSSHIAAGMHGAVIIDPEGLPQVDHEYALVQSEAYVANEAATSADAQEVDSAKLAAESPDFVTFNGIANQYDQRPLRVRAGETIRIWLVNAGPNRPLSFHIVGAQFDTAFKEGAYLIKDGKDAFGNASGGSQALDLSAAQGGFVELTFSEPGTYTMVNHVMLDAERGAHGTVEVRP